MSRHLGHLLVFGAPTVVLVGVMGRQEIRGRAAARAGTRATAAATRASVVLERSEWFRLTGGTLIAAGVVHAAVAPEHFREYFAYGVFFAVLTLAQWWTAALWLRRPTIATAEVLAAGSAAVVVLWALSRTTGLPLGPQPWTAERTGGPDMLATCFEALTCAACFVQVWTARHAPTHGAPSYEAAAR